MAARYCEISREDIEAWLGSLIRCTSGPWERAQGTEGVYLLVLSERVAVKISTTLSGSGEAMARGSAACQIRLVSRLTGRVLNKKAQGQSRFLRVENWRENWARGVENFRVEYERISDFYERIALPDGACSPSQPAPKGEVDQALVERARSAYRAARDAGRDREMDFLAKIGKGFAAGRNEEQLSPAQRKWWDAIVGGIEGWEQ